jgi:hypothetical protein
MVQYFCGENPFYRSLSKEKT